MGGAQPLAGDAAVLGSRWSNATRSSIDFRLRHPLRGRAGADARRGAGPHREIQRVRRVRRSPSRCSATRRKSCPSSWKRGVRPDAVTDQTSARSGVHGYLPTAGRIEQWLDAQKSDPDHRRTRLRIHAGARRGHAGLPRGRHSRPSDYGNNIRQMAGTRAVAHAFDFLGFCAGVRASAVLLRGIGPFRWVALSAIPEDIYKTDAR